MKTRFIFLLAFLIAAAPVFSCSTEDIQDNNETKSNDEEPCLSIPTIYIKTEGQKEIVSKEEYVDARVVIADGDSISDSLNCKIRGRGNWTWKTYPKKPYKLKFENKQTPFGFPADKEWVMLADYCDCSLLRTAYMSELSKAIQLDWSINYQHVNLYINNEYVGIYVFIDHLEKSKNRINISEDGFIIENDIYYYQEPLYFNTNSYSLNYTFKYPKTSGENQIVEGDDSWNYIVELMNKVENSLTLKDSALPELIDYESFAKWYILMELSLNVEPNIYYVLNKRGDKLKMYPAWDAEWSLGATYKSTWGGYDWLAFNNKVPFDAEFWCNNGYFIDLINDSRFRKSIVEVWDNVKSSILSVNDKITNVRRTLETSVDKNFERWQILGLQLSVCCYAFPKWEMYCDEIASFLSNRIEWFDYYVHREEFLNQEETAITINHIYKDKDALYNLNGIRINSKAKGGIIIKDGKKYIAY